MSQKTGKKVIWSVSARDELKQIYDYIKKDSQDQAKRVKSSIIKEAQNISHFPEKFEKERFLEGMEQEFRSRTIWNYKIVYELRVDSIVILKVFHTSQSIESLRQNL